jgi:hypothetical protein
MKLTKYILILAAGLFLSSCEDYLDINDNPNGAITPPLRGLLANVTYNTAVNVYSMGSTVSFYTQYLASPNQASPIDVYDRISTSGTWRNIYGVMGDIYDMERFATENNSYHYVGVSKVLMAINLGMIADAYGDAPYSEALDFQTIVPAYDSQEQLYGSIQTLLDDAIANLDRTNEGEALPTGNDFIHNGSVSKWLKTAYTIKARYLNHLTETGGYDANAVLAAVNQAYSSNEDDAQVTQFQNRNPWAQVAVNNANLVLGGWLSEQLTDAMNGTTFGVFDPRLPKITSPLPNGQYIGTANGVGRTGDGAGAQTVVYLTTNGFYSSTSSPLLIATYSELKFIEAEAAFRAGDRARAYAAYMEGIASNHVKLGVSEEDIATFAGNAAISVGAENLTLQNIFNQKYITTFLHPEAWVDARRFDYQYTDFTVPANDLLNGQFILRLDYPDTEYERNGSNVPSVQLLTPMFWDQ